MAQTRELNRTEVEIIWHRHVDYVRPYKYINIFYDDKNMTLLFHSATGFFISLSISLTLFLCRFVNISPFRSSSSSAIRLKCYSNVTIDKRHQFIHIYSAFYLSIKSLAISLSGAMYLRAVDGCSITCCTCARKLSHFSPWLHRMKIDWKEL